MTKLIESIKQIIRIKALNKKITQTELADRLDTSQQAVNKLLNHNQDISVTKMEKIAEALGVNFTDLLPLNIIQNNNEGTKENNQHVHLSERAILDGLILGQEQNAKLMNILLEIQQQQLELTKALLEKLK